MNSSSWLSCASRSLLAPNLSRLLSKNEYSANLNE